MINNNRPRIKELIHFRFFFLNMDISITLYIINLKFSVCSPMVLLEGIFSLIYGKKKVHFCQFIQYKFL